MLSSFVQNKPDVCSSICNSLVICPRLFCLTWAPLRFRVNQIWQEWVDCFCSQPPSNFRILVLSPTNFDFSPSHFQFVFLHLICFQTYQVQKRCCFQTFQVRMRSFWRFDCFRLMFLCLAHLHPFTRFLLWIPDCIAYGSKWTRPRSQQSVKLAGSLILWKTNGLSRLFCPYSIDLPSTFSSNLSSILPHIWRFCFDQWS